MNFSWKFSVLSVFLKWFLPLLLELNGPTTQHNLNDGTLVLLQHSQLMFPFYCWCECVRQKTQHKNVFSFLSGVQWPSLHLFCSIQTPTFLFKLFRLDKVRLNHLYLYSTKMWWDEGSLKCNSPFPLSVLIFGWQDGRLPLFLQFYGNKVSLSDQLWFWSVGILLFMPSDSSLTFIHNSYGSLCCSSSLSYTINLNLLEVYRDCLQHCEATTAFFSTFGSDLCLVILKLLHVWLR